MAEGVVYLFKFVEVNEDNGEWTAGARGTFPLGRERFPEETTRLDAGKAVGDRLLLQLLEDERIVQRGGKQVGQSIHDQNVF